MNRPGTRIGSLTGAGLLIVMGVTVRRFFWRAAPSGYRSDFIYKGGKP